MDVVLNKWGNSLGLRIPRELVESFKFQPGSRINITADDNKIVIKPSTNIEVLFESYYGKTMSSITRDDIGVLEEVDWGNDVGGEIVE